MNVSPTPRWVATLMVAAVVGGSGVHAAAIDTLVDGLAVDAPLPGRKDLANTLGPMRVGYPLWDTAEKRGGYNGLVAELALEQIAGSPSPIYTMYPPGVTTPLADMVDPIYPYLFTRDWAQLSFVGDMAGSMTGDGNDFETAFASPDIGFVSFQHTVFSPYKPDPSLGVGTTVPFTFPELTTDIATLASAAGLKMTQNIGFANNFLFPAGQFDFNVAYPMVTKHPSDPVFLPPTYDPTVHSGDPTIPLHPQLATVPWGLLYQAQMPPANPEPLALTWVPMNLLHPEVADLVTQSIAERVSPTPGWPSGLISYHLIVGEYNTDWLSNKGFLSPFDASSTDCSLPMDAARYFDCLGNTDYSNHSYFHFRTWLGGQYADVAALSNAWSWPAIAGCPSFFCATIDPLKAVADGADVAEVFDDWRRFQGEQRVESENFQYRAAKQTRPDESMYVLHFDAEGVERGAQLSNGVASGNWYSNNASRADLLSPMKKLSMHGITYGESLNFPIFGMPRSGVSPCEVVPTVDPETPFTYLPPCWDVDFSYRTLREFVTLGVNTLGVAYWENSTDWTQNNGYFTTPGAGNITELLAAEVASWRTRHAFMTPWRSPLLVHTGAAGGEHGGALDEVYVPGMTDFTIEALGRDQAHYAPFSRLDALDDPWVTSEREMLLSAFVPELDRPLVDAYEASAGQHGWDMWVLTDYDTLADMIVGQGLTYESIVIVPTGAFVVLDSHGGNGPFWYAFGFHLGTPAEIAAAEALIDSDLVDALEAGTATPMRPVTAVAPGTTTRLDDVDVTVMSDGVGLLVSVTNAGTQTQGIELVVDVPPAGPIAGWQPGGASIVNLGPAEAGLVYLPADVPTLAPITIAEIDLAINAAEIAVAQRKTERFDTAAADALLAELAFVRQDAPNDKLKRVAGLLRLERMPLLRYDAVTSTVDAVLFDGSPIVGAEVQLEFPLQAHARRSAPVTDAAGQSMIDPSPVAGAEVWDFVQEQYVSPQPSETHVVEIHVQHPVYETQTWITRELTVGP